MDVSSSVIERMNNIGSEKVVWLNEAEVSDMTGFIPENTEWFKANCPLCIGSDGNLDRQKMFECKSSLLGAEQKKAKFQWLLKAAPKAR